MFFFAVCGSAALVNDYLQARAGRVRPVDLYAVVNRQLADLRADDFSGAYLQASSDVREKFNLSQFATMIRSDCRDLVRAERVEFGFVESQGRRAIVQVFFFDKEGQVTPCIYTLVSEGDSWKIESARVSRRWPQGTRLGGMRS